MSKERVEFGKVSGKFRWQRRSKKESPAICKPVLVEYPRLELPGELMIVPDYMRRGRDSRICHPTARVLSAGLQQCEFSDFGPMQGTRSQSVPDFGLMQLVPDFGTQFSKEELGKIAVHTPFVQPGMFIL
uniref:Uncharacterized protein n=1 Tax=Lactuca sativa TaxID=4236 RepID=A0A9R1V7H8_LACSA|nr:hypothetical protein LSAT_V11C600317780 [Lactuca sativa]